VLLAAVVAVLVVQRIPFVGWLLMPLTWLGTLVHETGHALGALAVGGTVSSVEVFANGSGVAHAQLASHEPWRRAVVSVSGLVGPAVASLGLLWTGLGPRLAKLGAAVVGVGLCVLALTLTEGLATAVALGWGLLALVLALRMRGEWVRLLVLVVAVQLALQVYRGSGYLFVGEAHIDGRVLRSDVGNLADALGGHYLLWGLAVGLLDVALLGLGLLGFFRGDRWVSRRREG
jgi:hypothetical protein